MHLMWVSWLSIFEMAMYSLPCMLYSGLCEACHSSSRRGGSFFKQTRSPELLL
jgi:hypothetical protein